MEKLYNPFSLSSKRIVISGASSGIGEQCAISCSQVGASVVLIGRNKDRLEKTLARMENKDKHQIITVDLTDYTNVGVQIRQNVEQFGRYDGLLNCAGISTTLPLRLVTIEKMQEYFQTNVFSAINLMNEVCKVGRFNKEGGSIVFFSSIMGIVGESGKSLYGMTKGALVSAVRSLACEFAKKKIRVNSVSPGAILTPINESLPHMSDPIRRAMLEDKHLLGLGKTEDVANACIYLLSDASRWVTGINLIVDGGYTAK